MGSKENLPPPGGGRQIQRLNIPNIFRQRSASCSEFVPYKFPNKTGPKRGREGPEKVSRLKRATQISKCWLGNPEPSTSENSNSNRFEIFHAIE